MNHIKNNISPLYNVSIILKRVDELNYSSVLSPRSLKMNEEKKQLNTPLKNNFKKTRELSKHNENDIMNEVGDLAVNDDADKLFNISKKHSKKNSLVLSYPSHSDDDEVVTISLSPDTPKRRRKISESSFNSNNLNIVPDPLLVTPKHSRKTSASTPSKSRNNMNTFESVSSKRIRKSTNLFGQPVDINNIVLSNTPQTRKLTRKISIPLSSSSNLDGDVASVTPKHSRKSANGFRKLTPSNDIDVSNIIKSKRARKTSASTPSKSRDNMNTLEQVTPKRTRKSTNRFGDPIDVNKIVLSNTPPIKKHTQKMSIPSSYSNNSDSEIDTVGSITPKRTRNYVSQIGDLDDSEIENTPKSNKINRKMSVNNGNEDFEIDAWKTPKNKHNRLSYIPTTRSGSKVRRSILENIPENKEIDVVSTPKTPRKTPKTHVKHLTASVSKRLDCGVRVPCSPLEKARANLHLHAAPKHLPCREVEFKSIHSFLARKINDELTGSMYISGVPGTGKTATVKRVIDSLNSDLIMKHSFKFIEINGLKLANPHQAFSVIWKELTAETVSSSRAQVLLDNYFSGNEVRELSTILLVDEVDHICNRKQDVVYNILDWPSRTGSKVVVITIANTMDLPERVLRGCVTSRMGLTRLVFKPYTFQQLQEIIMNRLIGNSSFDPDAVQLVARKVAAVSGDARRALDICRRAIDLIKDDDDSQLITINHVTQVLDSILSSVRVTAIRYCSLFEQFFLRALRDETIRTGFDHSTIYSIHNQMKSICLLEGEELPNDQQVVMMSYRLRDNGLIFLEKKRWDLFRKVSLNVSPEDISYALDKYNN